MRGMIRQIISGCIVSRQVRTSVWLFAAIRAKDLVTCQYDEGVLDRSLVGVSSQVRIRESVCGC